MATAIVQNGKIVDSSASATSSSTSSTKAASSATSGLDKEAFLQLLVAQMQYQDPLEPTDNTEYIAQLATFSQLEATQNLADTITQDMGNNIVGKYVILDVDGVNVSGKVDYVMYENGEAFIAVNDGLYSLADLDTVADPDYYEAVEMANMFSTMVAKLPAVGDVTAANAEDIKNARAVFDAMSSYQQSFVSVADYEKLKALEEKIATLTGGGSSETTDG
ncbi:MAG: flagellar hook capping protein [Lachnospiraceae bacterium]|nr:flagellar hook capping protein [Lachnospiraceae bacterium]